MGNARCNRCNKWHQRLVYIWDNMADKGTLICLSCIAEIIEGRLNHLVLKTALLRAISEVC